ncbi:uncharacterized protein LOC122129900 [Clupea harengus]|uniref:Uncharacterized protein LOC122129900 n=1 Tax=Clupea harengus TaxID=7950 RepID=A0A8M1KFD4_CLUHA|nr:uncharacterized protein LOC122129900 [Clupea harengus]
MAKRLVEYYPMIKDKSSDNVWENVSRKLMKRLSNVKSPVKSKGPPVKVQRRNEDADDSSDWDSSASTVILERSPASTSTPKRLTDNNDEPSTGSGDLLDSEKSQARHYRTLQDMYKSKKPNKAAVSHLLDLEFQSRRQFIVSDTLKEQDRPGKILDAYPCFRELDHIMDELRRIINPDNPDYIANIKDRWETFYGKVQFYGVMRKFMKPPKTLDGVEHATAVFSALPQLFQSPAMAPKKTRTPSKVFFHILTSCESPDSFLLTRSHPIVLLGQENCLLSIGPTTLCSFPKIKFHEAILYLMGCYYVFHLTYPKCIATLLSVIQTEVLGDGLHERDITPSYKRAIADWKAFID